MAEEIKNKPSNAELQAENERLRAMLDQQNKKAQADLQPGFYRCRLQNQKDHFSVVVKAANKADAILQTAKRMGIMYGPCARKGIAIQVKAAEVTQVDLDKGAEPATTDKFIVEYLGTIPPPIESHIRTYSNGAKQLLYSANELKELGYKAEEISQFA